MRRSLFLILVLCAAIAPVGLSSAGASAQRRSATHPAAKQGARKTSAPKPAAAADAKPATEAAAKPTAPPIEVRQIDEAGLSKLLKDEAARGRPLLVNFWATWCAPCREEFPDLVRVEEEFGEKEDFEFVTVSLDDPADIATAVPRFLSEMRAGRIPAYLLNATDPEAAIALIDKTWHGELPATFLFGRKGEVFFKHTGRVKLDELRKAVRTVTSDE
jgi:thiol-disulfide isomerase/thioredoxin